MKKRELLILSAFAALMVLLWMHHEVWRDEVRALSIATTTPTWAAMLRELPHEGHPVLWYAILRAAHGVVHSNIILPFVAISIAIATAWLILRYAPFPLWLRTLAVFGVFLGYELSIVARNYGIGVLLIVTACVAFRNRDKRPLLVALPLALAANTSVHAAIACVMVLFFWGSDLLDKERRSALLSLQGIAAILVVLMGVAVSVISSRPTPDMAFAGSLNGLDAARVLRSVLIDPGKGLLGYRDANIAGAGEFPWRLTPISAAVASRIIVDLVLIWLAILMRRSPRALLTIVLSILAFEILFRNVYTGGARHEGILFFLMFAICWMDVEKKPAELRAKTSARLATALLPLFAFQSAALLVVAQRVWKYPESGSKAYGAFIHSNPRYSGAILLGEPDYFMESLPYYVNNPIYMPRQQEFTSHVYFDKGARRRTDLTLTELGAISDSVACTHGKTVLLAFGRPQMTDSPGEAYVAYHARFRWTPEQVRTTLGALRQVADFPRAVTDEVYRVYEVEPRTACARRAM